MVRLFESNAAREERANREAAELELMIRGANAHLIGNRTLKKLCYFFEEGEGDYRG